MLMLARWARCPVSSTDSSHPVGAPRSTDHARWGWIAMAGMLLAGGALLHGSGLNVDWMAAAHRAPLLPPEFWSVLTQLGTGLAIIAIASLLDALGVRVLGALAVAFAIGTLLTHVPKLIAPSARPAATAAHDWLVFIGDPIGGSASMPSGHALAAFALATLLCRISPLLLRQGPLRAAVLAWAALVAWSRVAVGAHWPADVLAGAGLGIATALLAVHAAQHLRLEQRLAGARARIGLRLVQAVVVLSLLGSSASGPWAGATQWLLAAVLGAAWLLRLWRWRHAQWRPLAGAQRVTSP